MTETPKYDLTPTPDMGWFEFIACLVFLIFALIGLFRGNDVAFFGNLILSSIFATRKRS